MVRIDVLGPFAVRTGDETLGFEARSAAAVVAYLALARGRPVSRDVLASALWPTHDVANGRTNLRKALQRVRKALPDGSLVQEGDGLWLEATHVETDLDQADRLHRTYLLAARQAEGLTALAQEWAIRRRIPLEGWDDDWVEACRAGLAPAVNDVGLELALAQEAMGDLAAALCTWHELLERVPHHAQALQNAMRLELQLRGRERAAELALAARRTFREELGIEMPLELRRTVREIRSGGYEPVPPPVGLRKRSELHLLARMFEANLADGRPEALALLARECTISQALAHPKTMLSLLTFALEHTQGASPERIEVAALAATTASWASQYETGHLWSDFVLENASPDDLLYGRVLSMKGFMLFEQRDYEGAKSALARAMAALEANGRHDDAARAGIARAGVHWHQEEFEPAIALYEAAYARASDRRDEIAILMRGSACSNLCFVYTTLGQWEKAIRYGRTSLRYADDQPVLAAIVPGPLGVALYMHGERAEGLRMLDRGLAGTIREGMTRFNQITLDFVAAVLAVAGRTRPARCLLAATGSQRAALRHARSPAERRLIASITGFDPETLAEADNPLLGQSAATLSEWAGEELERLQGAGSEAVRPA